MNFLHLASGNFRICGGPCASGGEGRDDQRGSSRNDFDVDGEGAGEVAVDLDGSFFFRPDFDFFTSEVVDISVDIHFLPEHAPEVAAPVDNAASGDTAHVEEAVVANGFVGNFKGTAVAADVSDEDRRRFVFDQFAVDFDVDFGRSVRIGGVEERPNVVPLFHVALPTSGDLSDDVTVHSRAEEGVELSSSYFAEVDLLDHTLGNGFDKGFRVLRKFEFFAEDVAGAHGEDGEGDLLIAEAVDDFVDGSVAADGDDRVIGVVDFLGGNGGVAGTFGLVDFQFESLGLEPSSKFAQVFAPTSLTRGGVEDNSNLIQQSRGLTHGNKSFRLATMINPTLK